MLAGRRGARRRERDRAGVGRRRRRPAAWRRARLDAAGGARAPACTCAARAFRRTMVIVSRAGFVPRRAHLQVDRAPCRDGWARPASARSTGLLFSNTSAFAGDSDQRQLADVRARRLQRLLQGALVLRDPRMIRRGERLAQIALRRDAVAELQLAQPELRGRPRRSGRSDTPSRTAAGPRRAVAARAASRPRESAPPPARPPSPRAPARPPSASTDARTRRHHGGDDARTFSGPY